MEQQVSAERVREILEASRVDGQAVHVEGVHDFAEAMAVREALLRVGGSWDAAAGTMVLDGKAAEIVRAICDGGALPEGPAFLPCVAESVIEDLWDRGDEWAEHRCLVAGAGVIQLADIVSRIDYGATIVGVVEDAGSVEALKGYAARVVQGTLAGYARSAGPERFSLIVLAPPVAEVAEQMEAAYPLLAAGGRILCFLPEALVDADPRDVLPSWPGIRGESFPNGGGCGHHPGITRVWYVDAPSRER